MLKLTVTGNILAKSDRIDWVKAELEKLVPITRAEAGCIQYDLHQDNENPAYFMFYEKWESRELWQMHMNAPHLSAYMKATEGDVEKFWFMRWRTLPDSGVFIYENLHGARIQSNNLDD